MLYGSTSVRWILHTLTPNETHKCEPWNGDWLIQCAVAINPAATVVTVNVNLNVPCYVTILSLN